MELIQLKVGLRFTSKQTKSLEILRKGSSFSKIIFHIMQNKHRTKEQETYHISVALLQVDEVSTHFRK